MFKWSYYPSFWVLYVPQLHWCVNTWWRKAPLTHSFRRTGLPPVVSHWCLTWPHFCECTWYVILDKATATEIDIETGTCTATDTFGRRHGRQGLQRAHRFRGIHTCIHTYMHSSIHNTCKYIQTYEHTHMHACVESTLPCIDFDFFFRIHNC